MAQEKTAKLPPLEISTLLFVRELFQDDRVVFPVGDANLVSYGSAIESIEEQSLFLREYLATATPEMLARFSLPAGTELREIDVDLAPSNLPERLARPSPITIPCLLIPAQKRDVWVVVLPLNHTFYVSGNDDLEESIRSEVQRIAAAQEETSPWAFLKLFPAKKHELTPFSVNIEREEPEALDKVASRQKAFIERRRQKEAYDILFSVANALHLEEKPKPPLLQRDTELSTLRSLLDGEERLSVVLVGPELCGKSAVFSAWIEEEKKKPKPRPVFATSGAQLIAGMSGLGQWQERLRRVMEAAETLDAVIYFDNFGDLLAERQSGGIDIPGAMKRYLEEGKVRIVGEISLDALDLCESRHMGFFSCLSRLRIEPLDAGKAKEIVTARARFDREREPERPQLKDDAIEPLIDLAERYLPYRAFPGKVVRLYEELRLLGEQHTDGSGKVEIDRNRVFSAFSLKTGIPEKLLREDRSLKVEEVLEAFHKKLIGQEEAQRRVAEVVCVVKAGLQPTGKPLATFLFIGPTGVGKTELARTLAAFLFGSEERMIRFDMSEYMDPEAAERLIRGTERAEGILTRKVRQEPFCVLLLDEVEKAHPAVFDLLLQVCGEGRLTDARGKTAYFHNTIIIMTSNLGAAQKRAASGFMQSAADDEAFYQKQVNRAFRPEFVNRLDRIITFQPLSQEQIQQVARLLINKSSLRRGFVERGVLLKVTPKALDVLSSEGFSEKYGARALRRHVEDHLIAPCAQILSKIDPELRGAQMLVSTKQEPSELKGEPLGSLETESLRIEISRPTAQKTAKERRGFEAISAIRRKLDSYLALERVSQVKEQLEFLISQMSYGGSQKNSKDQRLSIDISSLQNEYHRLQTFWEKAASIKAEVDATEEVGLLALFEGQEIEAFKDEAAVLEHSFTRNLVYLLLCLEPKRDQITLLIQELDNGRAFDHWLLPFLETAEAMAFEVQIHIDGGGSLPGEQWPSSRRWGSPRTPEQIIKQLEQKNRPFKSLLLRIEGPFAGVFFALECGLHRYIDGSSEGDEAHMFCRNISLRTRLTDEEWLLDELAPEAPPPPEELRPVTAVRELTFKEGKLNILKKIQLEVSHGARYWERFHDILLAHLMMYEDDLAKDRDDVFQGRLEKRIVKKALKGEKS